LFHEHVVHEAICGFELSRLSGSSDRERRVRRAEAFQKVPGDTYLSARARALLDRAVDTDRASRLRIGIKRVVRAR